MYGSAILAFHLSCSCSCSYIKREPMGLKRNSYLCGIQIFHSIFQFVTHAGKGSLYPIIPEITISATAQLYIFQKMGSLLLPLSEDIEWNLIETVEVFARRPNRSEQKHPVDRMDWRNLWAFFCSSLRNYKS